jgi:hypothetical protein
MYRVTERKSGQHIQNEYKQPRSISLYRSGLTSFTEDTDDLPNYCFDLGCYLGAGTYCFDHICPYADDCRILRASERSDLISLTVRLGGLSQPVWAD